MLPSVSSSFQLVSWNVNSLRVRLQHLQELIQAQQPDVICLQETKVMDESFPWVEVENMGFGVVFSGQKTYNGVAILYRQGRVQLRDYTYQSLIAGDSQKRFISARLMTPIGELDVASVYVPNGREIDTPAYEYKLDWLKHLKQWCESRVDSEVPLIVCGDFNVAPTDNDVYNPDIWREQILCSTPERQALQSLVDIGLNDAYHHQTSMSAAEQPNNQHAKFTWWDYRQFAFPQNKGLRIDLILAEPKLLKAFDTSVRVDLASRRKEKPSDHAPVILKLQAVSNGS
jgi:exodeoxyribonuclease-3